MRARDDEHRPDDDEQCRDRHEPEPRAARLFQVLGRRRWTVRRAAPRAATEKRLLLDQLVEVLVASAPHHGVASSVDARAIISSSDERPRSGTVAAVISINRGLSLAFTRSPGCLSAAA
jgi:hypothetical protein